MTPHNQQGTALINSTSICLWTQRCVSICLLFAAVSAGGCAQFQAQGSLAKPLPAADIELASHQMQESQVEVGRPNMLIDGVGWVVGIPEKVLLWDRRAVNHNVSPETIAVVDEYVRSNGLRNVKVRVNQYDPGGEWKRLTTNHGVSPLWRYTFGAVGALGYTLIPGRLFGTDNYNPYTNTISIYSDLPAVAVHEAAYAHDNALQQYHGTYGFGQGIPGINIYHETKATDIAYNWLQSTNSPELIEQSNRTLPPLYGMRVGGSLGELFPQLNPVFVISGAATGHVFGRRLDAQQPVIQQTASPESINQVIPVGHQTEN